MERQLITIERITYEVNQEKYKLYLIPENQGKDEIMTLCMLKEGYAVMTYLTDFPMKEYNQQQIDDFIDTHLASFVKHTECDIQSFI